MQPIYQGKRKVREFVDTAAISIVRYFYPSAVAKYANLPLDVAFKYLLELVDSGEIYLRWELRCPNYTCIRKIGPYVYAPLLGEELCTVCGEEFEAKASDYYPIFEITPEFKIDILSQKKTKTSFLQLQHV